METVEFVNGKMAVELEGDFYHAHTLPLDISSMEEEEAYIFGDLILPYRGTITPPKNMNDMTTREIEDYEYVNMSAPGFYKVTNPDGANVLLMQKPKHDNYDEYSADKVIVLDIDKLVDRISSDDFLSPEAIEQLNMSSDYREFVINPDDDFLKILVKTVINAKKINLKIFGSRLPKRHNLANMINSLDSTTKMSVKYFMIWKELLEFEFEINVTDDSLSVVPMHKTVTYTSVTGGVETHD